MRPINRFGVRTVSLALCVALVASSGQPLWAAVGEQAQVRSAARAVIPALPAVAAGLAAGLAIHSGAPEALPWILPAAAVPLLGVISEKEKWDEIKKFADEESTDRIVKQAIQERARALELLERSRARVSGEGAHPAINDLLSIVEAQAAAGHDVGEAWERAKNRAQDWEDWIKIARLEQRSGADPRASIEKARQNIQAVTRPGISDLPRHVYALTEIGRSEREAGLDAAASFSAVREAALNVGGLDRSMLAGTAVMLLTRLAQVEIETKADVRPTIAALKEAVGQYRDYRPDGERIWRARNLAHIAKLEMEAGLDPGASLSAAAELMGQVEIGYPTRDVQSMVAGAEAKAAKSLLEKSKSILWDVFRFGSGSVIAAGLLTFLAPAPALAATAAGSFDAKGIFSWMLLSVLAFPFLGVLTYKEKWDRIQKLVDDPSIDSNVKQAIQERSQALNLLEVSWRRSFTIGSHPSVEDITALMEAELAAGLEAADVLAAMKRAAQWAGIGARKPEPWLAAARLEIRLGLDAQSSIEQARKSVADDVAGQRLVEAHLAAERDTELESKPGSTAVHAKNRLRDVRARRTQERFNAGALVLSSVLFLGSTTIGYPVASVLSLVAFLGSCGSFLYVLSPKFQGKVAGAEARAALALFKKSSSILWNAFRIGMPVLAVGLLVFIVPSLAWAATATAASQYWWPAAFAALGIGAMIRFLPLKKWTEIYALADDDKMDQSLRGAIQQHARARELLKAFKQRHRDLEYAARVLAHAAMLELEAGMDPSETLDNAERIARSLPDNPAYSDGRMLVAAAKGLAGQDPDPLLEDAKRAIHGREIPENSDDYWEEHPESFKSWTAAAWIQLAQAEAVLGRDYTASLSAARDILESMRFLGMNPSVFAEMIADVAAAAAKADLDPAPALRIAREVNAREIPKIFQEAARQDAARRIDAVAAGTNPPFNFFGMPFDAEDNAALGEIRFLLQKSQPKLWPLHRVGAAPLVLALAALFFLSPAPALAATAASQGSWSGVALAAAGLLGAVMSKAWVRGGIPLAFSPDGEKIAATVGSGEVVVSETATGRTLFGFSIKGRTDVLSWSPDGGRLAAAGSAAQAMNGTTLSDVSVVDAATGGAIASTLIPQSQDLAWSPDAAKIAARSYEGTTIVDAGSGAQSETIGAASDLSRRTHRVLWKDNGKIATADSAGTVVTWSADPVMRHKVFQASAYPIKIKEAEPSPDRAILAMAAEDAAPQGRAFTIILMDLESGRQKVISVKTEYSDLRFSPDGKKILGRDWDGMVSVWDTRTGRHLFDIREKDVIKAGFSRHGALIVTVSDGGIRTWDAGDGRFRDWVGRERGLVEIGREDGRVAITDGEATSVWSFKP